MEEKHASVERKMQVKQQAQIFSVNYIQNIVTIFGKKRKGETLFIGFSQSKRRKIKGTLTD